MYLQVQHTSKKDVYSGHILFCSKVIFKIECVKLNQVTLRVQPPDAATLLTVYMIKISVEFNCKIKHFNPSIKFVANNQKKLFAFQKRIDTV